MTGKILAEPAEPEDPVDIVYTACLTLSGCAGQRGEQALPPDAYGTEPFEEKDGGDEHEPIPRSKLHSDLEAVLSNAVDLLEQIEVIVTFADPDTIPRFPSLRSDEPRDSSTNSSALTKSNEMVEQIKAARFEGNQALDIELNDQFQVTTLSKYWLVKAFRVQMAMGQIRPLAERADVKYIELRHSVVNFSPRIESPGNNVGDARRLIMSDLHKTRGDTRDDGYVGLIDTGVRQSHNLFNLPPRLADLFDCVNGTSENCTLGDDLDPDDKINHGTASAAIICGNERHEEANRGVTSVKVNSYRVYGGGAGEVDDFLDLDAAARAFEAAIEFRDHVIVAEIAGRGDEASVLCTTADGAFDAGAIVIAANGNNGPAAFTVTAPAKAHKVLGVGCIDVQSGAQIDDQSRGPTDGDHRIKPDIQAPTNTETASIRGNDQFDSYGGTSGATPYAGGAAVLLRNFLRGKRLTIDPGQVYAAMILAGEQIHPLNSTQGAGLIRLPSNGLVWWGKVLLKAVEDGNIRTVSVPLDVIEIPWKSLDAAIWWPESEEQKHNDIDLWLVDPGGDVTKSDSVPSVFERTGVKDGVKPGEWKLQIRGHKLPTPEQVVYWAAYAHTDQ